LRKDFLFSNILYRPIATYNSLNLQRCTLIRSFSSVASIDDVLCEIVNCRYSLIVVINCRTFYSFLNWLLSPTLSIIIAARVRQPLAVYCRLNIHVYIYCVMYNSKIFYEISPMTYLYYLFPSTDY